MKKILIIGASGFIGKAFWDFYQRQSRSPLGTAHRPHPSFSFLDLHNPDLNVSFDPSEVSHGIIVAGITRLMECEQNPEQTYACNVSGILKIAKQLSDMGIQPVIPSSDYVFDGVTGAYEEDDCTNPLNHYGKQKQILETLIQETCKNALILRFSKVFSLEGDRGSTLLDEMAGKLERGEAVVAAEDQIFTPIHIEDLVFSVDRLMQANATGIFHICSPEKVSRYELALQIASALNCDESLVEAISLDDLEEPLVRPKRTDMCCRKLIQYANYVPRAISWFIEHYSLMRTDNARS